MASSLPASLQPPPLDFVAITKSEMQEMLTKHTRENGYKIIIRSSDSNNIRYVCHRSGHKPSTTSCSQKTNCPFSFTAYRVISPKLPSELQDIVSNTNLPPPGSWKLHIKHPGHNHEPMDSKVWMILWWQAHLLTATTDTDFWRAWYYPTRTVQEIVAPW